MLSMRDKSVVPLEGELTGRVLVLNSKNLAPKFRSRENQLWKAEGGFGCSPGLRGTAVYAVCQADGERARWERGDFSGMLKA